MGAVPYYVYILASVSRVLYTGVTNDLLRRLAEHRSGVVPSFTARYRTKRLVYFDVADDALSAIEREKQIKRWRRDKKVALIEEVNPGWRDLSKDL